MPKPIGHPAEDGRGPLRGIVRSNHWGIETQGQHEALVDPTTWARVQVQLVGRRGSNQDAAVVKRRMGELEQKKKRLVQAYIYDQAIDRSMYDEELAGLEEALTFAHLELRDAAVEDFDSEASWGYGRAILTNTYKLWEAADSEQKRRFQKMIFPAGVTFDGKSLGTPVTALIFNVLDPEKADLEGLVAHGDTGSNTTTRLRPAAFARLEKFLRRVDSFRRLEVAA